MKVSCSLCAPDRPTTSSARGSSRISGSNVERSACGDRHFRRDEIWSDLILLQFRIFGLSLLTVVMSDPKSRTGEQDKKNLMTLWVVHFAASQINTNIQIRIHSNGGKCAQIATSQPQLFIVYGGTVTRELPSLVTRLSLQ